MTERAMTLKSALTNISRHEELQFLLTNRIPRTTVTKFMGWFSKLEQPVVRDLSLFVWQQFSKLELEDTEERAFTSVHDCFTRKLKPGARPIVQDPNIMVSPCDGIVGGHGRVQGVTVIQAKGFPYTLHDLLGDEELVERYRDGQYVTLRLTSAMYHRFHAPHDLRVKRVNYRSGDTWNTHPIALARVEKLYCKNERAIIQTTLDASGELITLVPVAAVLVASIRLHFLDVLLHLEHKGPNVFHVDAPFKKGEEMGWFQHGSTIIVFAPRGMSLCENVKPSATIRMGQPLLRFGGKS
jgi:phosphatidylserine decarboxylase